jgi:hypothetical protein
VCSDCAMGKSKQKNIPKLSPKKATTKLECVGIDISYVNHESFGGAKFFILIHDELSDFIWSKFIKSKDMVTDCMIDWIHEVQK